MFLTAVVCCGVMQVGYDVGDAPEAMLQAGGRGQRRTATDARKQADMIKRLKACSGK